MSFFMAFLMFRSFVFSAQKLATMEVERVRNIPPDVRRRMEREKERKEREERRERAKQLDRFR